MSGQRVSGPATEQGMNDSRRARVAVVTGASAGIGRACAQALLCQGWNTVFLARRAEALDEAVAAASRQAAVDGKVPGEALALCCDVADNAAVEAAFDRIVQRFGRVDLLFNNAGIMGPAGSIDEIPLDAWERTLDANVRGAFNVARAAFARMRRQQPQGGRILNNGSSAAHTPRPRTGPYSVT